MESGEIRDTQIWATSYLSGKNPEYGRIQTQKTENFQQKALSWAPKDDDPKPYLEISFMEPTEITAVSTQGGQDGYFVQEFMIEYADSEGEKTVTEQVVAEDDIMTDRPTIFRGNLEIKK